MKLSLFDLHCDTILEMHRKQELLSENSLAVSLSNAAQFARYVQVMAFWTAHDLSDEEGWERLLSMYDHLKQDPSVQSGDAVICTAPDSADPRPQLLLAVEDLRILAGRIERVDQLFAMGFRILTPLWYGSTCIGGSHNTEEGLTDFGANALRRALTLSMIPDISHASRHAADEIFALAEEYQIPVIASHSNAHAVCPVSRNLDDRQIDRLLACRGIIGLNLYKGFLRTDGEATIDDILLHIDHFLARGAEDSLSLGGDMDGCDLLSEIPSQKHLSRLADRMLQKNYNEKLIRAIFFENAARFAAQHLHSSSHTQEGVS